MYFPCEGECPYTNEHVVISVDYIDISTDGRKGHYQKGFSQCKYSASRECPYYKKCPVYESAPDKMNA